MIKKVHIAYALTIGIGLLGSVNLQAELRRPEIKKEGESVGKPKVKVPERIKFEEMTTEQKIQFERDAQKAKDLQSGKAPVVEIKSAGKVESKASASSRKLSQMEIQALVQAGHAKVDEAFSRTEDKERNTRFKDAVNQLATRLTDKNNADGVSLETVSKAMKNMLTMIETNQKILAKQVTDSAADAAGAKAQAKVSGSHEGESKGRASSESTGKSDQTGLDEMAQTVMRRGSEEDVDAHKALLESGRDALQGALKINAEYQKAFADAFQEVTGLKMSASERLAYFKANPEAEGKVDLLARKKTREELKKLVEKGVLTEEDLETLCPTASAAAVQAAKEAVKAGMSKKCASARYCGLAA